MTRFSRMLVLLLIALSLCSGSSPNVAPGVAGKWIDKDFIEVLGPGTGRLDEINAPKLMSNALNDGPFVGSSKSDKYHYPSCSAAKKIKPENLVTFASSSEARAAGYVPCKICHPP